MEIIFSVTGNILIAELFGELDHHGAERVRERIDKAMDSHRSQKLILDFTNCILYNWQIKEGLSILIMT